MAESNFTIAKAAEMALLSSPDSLETLQFNVSKDLRENVRARVMTLGFDCTPNWGISGIQDSEKSTKNNWYFQDEYVKAVATDRFKNIDIKKLNSIINELVKNIVDEHEVVSGFGLYGSYFYRRNSLLPEDLDILIIVKNSTKLAIDAMRYEDPGLRNIYKNKSKFSPSSDEVGFSIISEDSFHPENQSYIVTDSALLDISTTLSIGKTVDAKPIPPFILIQNAKKIIHWGIASILSKPFSLLSRIDEAIRMRKMVIQNFPMIKFNEFAVEETLPSKEDILLGMNDMHLLEISRSLINLLSNDEAMIREYIATNLPLNNFLDE